VGGTAVGGTAVGGTAVGGTAVGGTAVGGTATVGASVTTGVAGVPHALSSILRTIKTDNTNNVRFISSFSFYARTRIGYGLLSKVTNFSIDYLLPEYE
jgi:hypothetical protein